MGPLPRTIIDVTCLATHYPYCVALKKVDTESMAKGLMEVIAHTGIPKELLTDQGGVFHRCQLFLENFRDIDHTPN